MATRNGRQGVAPLIDPRGGGPDPLRQQPKQQRQRERMTREDWELPMYDLSRDTSLSGRPKRRNPRVQEALELLVDDFEIELTLLDDMLADKRLPDKVVDRQHKYLAVKYKLLTDYVALEAPETKLPSYDTLVRQYVLASQTGDGEAVLKQYFKGIRQ
jgi:hypothetical protein